MISFNKKNRIFYLHTKKTTYAMGVLGNEVLVHLYWGKRLFSKFEGSWMYQKSLYTTKFRNLSAFDYGKYSTDLLPLEYSPFGAGDLKISALSCTHSDGSRVTVLRYKGYEIIDGKPLLEGLPSTYCEQGDKVQTLNIRLYDELKDIDVILSYSVFEDYDAITRSVRLENHGDKLRLSKILSATVDFHGMPESDVIHLDGAWARERGITRHRIMPGNQNVESRAGASSAYHNPFICVCDKNATENHGDVFGMNLVYSGNFIAGIEKSEFNCGRAYIGINPYNFEFILEKGESFQAPEAVLVYSSEGMGGMSRIYHSLYRSRLCRGKYRDADRFILINNWEATYFDFNEDKIVEIAKQASKIGVDTMVLDDGWFAGRTDDDAGLGDWYENRDRLPNGLESLAKKVNDLGMRFGLWFEPEMVNPKSNLFEAHPDFIIHSPGRKQSQTRNQYTLDLSRRDVCDYIIESVSKILGKANIEYVKWDMNRYMSEVGSALLPAERQGEVMHRYILGLYYVLETITSRYPNVLFESCASGGGRFDAGMLFYMPQTWTSDDSDAVERLKIQYGTSIVYPYSAMGAHVSACPNHQVKRTTPFEMRCNVAMPGQFGFELDLNKCTKKDLKTAEKSIIRYKELQRVFHYGDCFRLRSPFESDISAVEFVSEDKTKVAVCIYSKSVSPNAPDEYIRLQGLDADARYSLGRNIFGGDYLMNKGIHITNCFEHDSKIIVLNKL